MNAERLLALYDRVADSPDAVSRMRRFVLDLAVRGSLVEQDPADEPASELLKRIAAEKTRLVRAGKIKKPTASRPIDREELPFQAPRDWAWLRLRDIGMLAGGMTPSKSRPEYWSGDVIWLSPKDIKVDEVSDCELKITERGLSDTRLELFPAGSLFMVGRSGILKRTFPVAINRIPAASNQDLKVLVPFLKGQERYLQIMFRGLTDFILKELVKTGTTVQSLRYAEFEAQPFPLPPLAEQYRIVAKADELNALCDQLQVNRTQREETRDRLTKASHARLSAPDTYNEAFRANARFAINVLPQLSARADQVKHLRQTILDLAVRGKLVEQDPADEPASKLLAQIVAEKVRLVSLSKLKRRKLTEAAPRNGLGFSLRAGWAAATFADVLVELQTGPFGSALHQRDYEIGGTPVINPKSIQKGKIVPIETMAVGVNTLERLSTFKVQTGDIVMGRRGEMGRCAVVTEKEDGWLCGTGSLIFRLPAGVYAEFLAMLIGSPHAREYLSGSSVGATMQNLNQSILLAMSIGVPPTDEQHRIVAKVDELMALCDRLETSLGNAETGRLRLLESLIRDVLLPTGPKFNSPSPPPQWPNNDRIQLHG